MRKEAVSLPELASATNTYTYEIADSRQEIVATMQRLIETSTPQMALVSITLQFEQQRQSPKAQQSMRYFLENLRPLVRKTDEVFLLGERYYFLLLGTNLQGAHIVQGRLCDALLWRIHSISDGEIARPQGMSIGHSAYPEPYSNIERCIEEAEVARLNFSILPGGSLRHKGRALAGEEIQQATESIAEGASELHSLARKLGIPYLSLLPHKLPLKVQQLVNPRLAQELHCYPVGRERDVLTVAMSNPQDREALDRLARETGLHIFPVLAHPEELETALAKLV